MLEESHDAGPEGPRAGERVGPRDGEPEGPRAGERVGPRDGEPEGPCDGEAGESRDGERIVLTDPRAIRALAHPARLALIEALGPGEELTATEAAAVTGLSPSATSYHLKALAKWGIVEAGQARADGRDRPWRAKGRTIEVSSRLPETTVIAELAILSTFLDRNRAVAAEFLENQASEPEAWRDLVEAAGSDYWLTEAELREVARAMRAVLEPYQDRRRADRPTGSRRVRIARLIVPRALSTPSDEGGTTGD